MNFSRTNSWLSIGMWLLATVLLTGFDASADEPTGDVPSDGPSKAPDAAPIAPADAVPDGVPPGGEGPAPADVVRSGEIPEIEVPASKEAGPQRMQPVDPTKTNNEEPDTYAAPYVAIVPAMGRWVDKETICPGCAYTKKIPICDTIDIPVYRIYQVPRYRTVRTPRYEWRTVKTYRTCNVPTYKEVDVALYDYRDVPVMRTRKVYKYEDVDFPVLKTERVPARREVFERQYEQGEIPNYVKIKVPKREIIRDCLTGDEICRVCGEEEKEVLQGTKRFKTLTGHKRVVKPLGVRLRWKEDGVRKVRRVTGITVEKIPGGTKREKIKIGSRKEVRIVGHTTQKIPCGTCLKRVKVGETVSRVYSGYRYAKQRIGTRTIEHANGYRTQDIVVQPGSRITERNYVRTPRRVVTVIPDESATSNNRQGLLPETTEIMTESEYRAALFGQDLTESK